MKNRYILGPDDVRRTPAEHAAAFPPPKKSAAPSPAPAPQAAPEAAANQDKPKGAKAK